MPTLLSQGIIHNLKANEVYALPAQEIVYNSEQAIELSSSNDGPWSPASDIGRTYENQIIADGAVAYWRLDEVSGTVVKSKIAGVPDGTINGSVTLNVKGALSDSNGAMGFNLAGQADGRVVIPFGSFNAFGTGEFTIEAWFQHAVTTPLANEYIYRHNAATGAQSIRLYFTPTVISFYIEGVASDSAIVSFSASSLLDNLWHHLVVLLRRGSPNDTLELWIDGTLKQSTSTPTGKQLNATGVSTIGSHDTTNEYIGNIDEVVLYKTALTPQQIQNHYAARARTYQEYVIQDGAVSYWRLNESSGTTVKSLVSGVPDGTLSGAYTLGIDGCLSDNDKGINFNPSGPADGQVSIPNGAYNAFGTDPFSIEYWFKRSNIAISADEVPVVLGNMYTASSIAFRISSPNISFILKDSLNAGSTALTPTASYLDDQWHYVAGIVRRGSPNDTMELWIDGILKNSYSFPTGRIYTINTTSMIAANLGTNEWQGGVDEVAVYKLALSPEQIKNHYEARKIIPSYSQRVVNDGAVSYWRLNETGGTVIKSSISGPPDGVTGGVITFGVSGALSDGDKAMSFNLGGPADTFINIPNGAWIAYEIGPITIEAWFRMTVVPTINGIIFGAPTPLSGNPAISISVSSSLLVFTARDTTGAQAIPAIDLIPLIDGKWHHAVGVVRRSSPNDIYELWVDGILGQSLSYSTGRNYTSAGPQGRIGGHSTSGEFVGEVDECANYKVALTPAQIQSHYQSSLLNYSKVIKGGFIRSSGEGKFICKS